MRRFLFLSICLLFVVNFCIAQQSFDDYRKSSSKKFNYFAKQQNKTFERFTAEQNAEFAAYIEQQWQLFEDFRKSSSPFSEPKLQDAPVAAVTNSVWSLDFDNVINFIVKSISFSENQVVSNNNSDTNVVVNFYGEDLSFRVNDNLRLTVGGNLERNVADYLRTMTKYATETSSLWSDIVTKADEFGLNEWGKYLLTKSIADALFVNESDKVAFCFYMLRNMGGYKVKVGRSVDDGNLVLLVAIDNSKEVYNYGYFNFKEKEQSVRYYLVQGNSSGSIYTYDLNNQDLNLSQVKLDFDKALSIGECDRLRELKIRTLNSTIDLPFNSKNIAFLDDVPQTVFPIYFVSAVPLESQKMLNEKFGNLRNEYSASEAVGILLNFVQTAFDYKTDADQFGREKYFYPEESFAYPYCDCEDRSALFVWLVRQYLEMPVIGLQYPGHVATAVCLGEDVNISGEAFVYGGKKYYVCDPTYINANVGQEMPQFKNVTPIVIKLKKI